MADLKPYTTLTIEEAELKFMEFKKVGAKYP